MCSFSRRVNLAKGAAYGGKLGRTGINGSGLDAKHLKRVGDDSMFDGPGIRTADLVSAVSEKERDKISAITSSLRNPGKGGKETLAKYEPADPSSFYPDFSYQPETWENRGKPVNDAMRRKPVDEETGKDDDKVQPLILGAGLALILLVAGLAQLGSCVTMRDDLRTIPPARTAPTPHVPQSILDF